MHSHGNLLIIIFGKITSFRIKIFTFVRSQQTLVKLDLVKYLQYEMNGVKNTLNCKSLIAPLFCNKCLLAEF